MPRSARSGAFARPADGPSEGPSAGQASLLRRLHRLEGQAAGVGRMIEADRPFALLTLQEELDEVVDDAARIDRVLAELRPVIERTSRLP